MQSLTRGCIDTLCDITESLFQEPPVLCHTSLKVEQIKFFHFWGGEWSRNWSLFNDLDKVKFAISFSKTVIVSAANIWIHTQNSVLMAFHLWTCEWWHEGLKASWTIFAKTCLCPGMHAPPLTSIHPELWPTKPQGFDVLGNESSQTGWTRRARPEISLGFLRSPSAEAPVCSRDACCVCRDTQLE